MTALADILGDSPGIQRLRGQLEHILRRAAVAPRPPAILIRGETGTGKSLVARTIHRAGPRARAPFVDVNCAAIPETLLEAELFGYERGAFTDARHSKPGLFQLAHHGVLFLDEIGMLPPALQAKLLKVLEDGAVRRLGGTRTEPVDVWIVSATNDDLAEALRTRRFREDLYHRLGVLSFELPALRERGPDILRLAERFLARACADYGLPPKTLARDARAVLAAYPWPGNVRELGNVVERVALLTDEPVVTAAMLALPVGMTADDRPGAEPARAMSSRDQLRAHLVQVLTETGWNISRTAVRLGVARNTVLARMARFGLRTSGTAHPCEPRAGDGPARVAPAPTRRDTTMRGVASAREAWEQRRVTLLRVDVVSATGAADASRGLVDDLIEKARMFGGDLIELGPSALVAAFGLDGIEDAPVRAALAALAMRNGTEREHRAGAGSRVKIVVHVALGLVSRHQGTPTIDLESKQAAGRTIEALVGLDALDAIVVSEGSAPFLERRFELTPASTIAATAVAYRRLLRRERTGFGLGGRPLSPFVGRDGPLRRVTERLASTAGGAGQVIGIVGEPGVGKSRFVYELTRLDATRDWRIVGSAGAPHGSTTPFLAVSDLLRRYFAIEDADGPEVIREKVTEAVRSRHGSLASDLTPLLSLLDLLPDDPAWPDLDPPQRRRQIQDATRRLLLDESRVQPLLLIVEDLQWVDAETEALLDTLVDSLPSVRILLVVSARPEYRPRWSSAACYTQVRMDPLPPECVRQLLRLQLGDDASLEPIKRRLAERTDGNPFFLEESIRALVEREVVVGEPGAYRAADPRGGMETPATVHAILAGRMERLRPAERRLLQSAAVIGREVPFELLQAVVEEDRTTLREGLARLQAAEFLYETRMFPDLEYTFKHALTHEVAYGSLTEERRRALHALLVGAIEALYSDRLEEHVERLADHALLGDLRERAVPYLRQAGLKAVSRAAPREALGRFEEALRILDAMPEDHATLAQRFEIHLEVRTVLNLLGEGRAMLERVREAERLAERLNDDHRRGHVCALLAHIQSRLGDLDEALESGTRALAIADRLGDFRLRIPATTYLEQAQYFRGEPERVVALATANLAALSAESIPEAFGLVCPPSVVDRCSLILGLAELGRFTEAAGPAGEAIRLATLTRNAFSIAWAHLAAGWVRLVQGDWAEACAFFEHATAAVSAGNVASLLSASVGFSAWGLAQLGEAGEALGRLREGEQHLRRQAAGGYIGDLGWGYLPLGRAALVLGRLDDARRLADGALEFSRRQPGFAAHALRLLGDVAARRDPFDGETAEPHYRQALALAEPRGMRPLVAHCHLGLGQLYRSMGKREEAQRHLTTATTMYGEMDMRFWLEQALVEAATQDPPKARRAHLSDA